MATALQGWTGFGPALWELFSVMSTTALSLSLAWGDLTLVFCVLDHCCYFFPSAPVSTSSPVPFIVPFSDDDATVLPIFVNGLTSILVGWEE